MQLSEIVTNLLPVVCVAIAVMLVMLAVSVRRQAKISTGIALVGLAGAFVANVLQKPSEQVWQDFFVFDGFALAVQKIILVTTAILLVFSYDYFHKRQERADEFYILILVSTCGALLLTGAVHFASFFVALELLTVPLIALVAYNVQEENATEGGMKFVVLAGVSSAFLLFGMALIFAHSHSLSFQVIAKANMYVSQGVLLYACGFAMIAMGVFFKLSLVPFHMWAPDVFQSAPLPVMAFLATVSKGSVIALLMRLFVGLSSSISVQFALALTVVAILSMVLGNLQALWQKNIKRLLAYSSISHMGYMLIAILSLTLVGVEALLFYMAQYAISLVCVVGALLWMARDHDLEELEDLRGMVYQKPLASGLLIVAFLSLMGVPFTAGFMGKYFIFLAATAGMQFSLLVVFALSSALGLYAYLRVVMVLFQQPQEAAIQPSFSWPLRVLATLLGFGILAIGAWPMALSIFMQNGQLAL